MAQPKKIPKAKLVMAIMYSDRNILKQAMQMLNDDFGKVEFESPSFDFNFTDYYEKEFGKDLKKLFIIFKEPVKREELVTIRIYTQEIEDKLKKEEQRTINIDPGYLTKDNLIVASLKEQPYKIYLGKGVFAHMIFMFKKDDVTSFKHTFPDYQDNKDFFLKARRGLFQKRNI